MDAPSTYACVATLVVSMKHARQLWCPPHMERPALVYSCCTYHQQVALRSTFESGPPSLVPEPEFHFQLMIATYFVEKTLLKRNMGQCPKVSQIRLKWSPYMTHPMSCCARRLLHVQIWSTNVPTPHMLVVSVVYICVHLTIMQMYVGQATCSLLARSFNPFSAALVAKSE